MEKETQASEFKSQLRHVAPPLLPTTFTQCLNGAVDEFVDAVEKFKKRFPNLSDEQVMTYVMQLKSMCTPREVR